MLVLTRKESEEIVLTLDNGQRISVQVCGVKGRACKIGVQADPSVQIFRAEIQPDNTAPKN